jgi:hypothetical protein
LSILSSHVLSDVQRKLTCLINLPSPHRNYPRFHYQLIGQKTISIQDGLYDGILKVLAGCIKPKDNQQSISEQETQDIIESLRPCYRGGSRNEIVFALCGLCRKNNISKESIRSLIDALAIDDEEKNSRLLVLNQTYEKDPRTVSGSKRLLEVLEHAAEGNSSAARDIFQKILGIIASKRYAGDDIRKVDHVKLLTDQLMNEYTFKTFKDTEEVCYYDSNRGVYVQGGKWLIEEQCEILCPQIQTYKVQEVVNHIKRRTGIERSMFDSNLNILNLQNGLLNIETGDFREHSPVVVSTIADVF